MPPDLVDQHLADMRLRGLAEATTIYARARALTRLAAWLDGYHGPQPGPDRCSGGPSRGISVAASGPGLLADASVADLLAWRTQLTISPKSVGPYVDHVRGFYDFLVRAGYRPDNPAAGLPVPRGHRSLPRPISEDDLWRAFTTASRRVRPWLALAAGAGFRAVEIAYLRRENVHDTAAHPFLMVAEDATKGCRERIVPMSAFVAAELAAYGLPPRGLVFRRHDGQQGPNRPWLISKLSNQALHSSGTGATLHALRHRFLTLAYQQSLDLRLVQELAGHASPATTAVYTLVSPGRAAEVVEAIPAPRRLRAVSE